MLKFIRLSAALAAATVVVSFPQIVRSRPASGNSGYASVRNIRSGSLYCYMRTSQGTLLNLENMCGSDNGSSDRAANVTNNPATTAPNGTAPNGVPNGQQPVTTTVNGSVVPNTANNTNPNAIGNPNGTNTNLNNSNPNGANTNLNNTNLNGTNTNANSNPNAINTNANNSNTSGLNNNTNSNSNATNTSPNNLQ